MLLPTALLLLGATVAAPADGAIAATAGVAAAAADAAAVASSVVIGGIGTSGGLRWSGGSSRRKRSTSGGLNWSGGSSRTAPAVSGAATTAAPAAAPITGSCSNHNRIWSEDGGGLDLGSSISRCGNTSFVVALYHVLWLNIDNVYVILVGCYADEVV